MPYCENIDAIANFSQMIAKYLKPIQYHTKPRHFMIRLNERGNVRIWTKALCTSLVWQFLDNSASEGFELLQDNSIPSVDKIVWPDGEPKQIEIGYDPKQIAKTIKDCQHLMSKQAFKQNEADLVSLQDLDPVPFHWVDRGKFKHECADYINNSIEEEEQEFITPLRHSAKDYSDRLRNQALIGSYAIFESNDDDKNRFWVGKILKMFVREKGWDPYNNTDEKEGSESTTSESLNNYRTKYYSANPSNDVQWLTIQWMESSREFGPYKVALRDNKEHIETEESSKVYMYFNSLNSKGIMFPRDRKK